MTALVVYLLMGVVASCVFLIWKPKAKHAELNPLAGLAEPYSGLVFFLLWPLFVGVMFFDRRIPEETFAAPQEHAAPSRIGAEGVVVLEFRPLGRVRIDGKLFDATCADRSLPVGTKIRVVSQKLGELTVEKVRP